MKVMNRITVRNYLSSKKDKVADEPIDVLSVGEVNDEGVPLDTIVNTRLSRVCGLATPTKGIANHAGIH
jgi:hypothetical protein